MAGRLEGKVAVVTGAASGIGLATVERLVAEGACVVAGDIQDEKGEMLARRFSETVRYRRCDVTREAEIQALMDLAPEAFGGLDIVFNNAGAGGTMATLEELTAEGFRSTIDLLVTSVVLGAKHAIPHLKARGGGAIVNTASIAGLQAGAGPIAYSIAKAGVIQFTKVAAAQLAQHKIRVTAICPGLIATSIFGSGLGLPVAVADQMAALIAERAGPMQPLGRPGRPEDIAAAVAFLGSDDGSFITGTHIVIDGGLTVGPRNAWDPEADQPLLSVLGVTPEQAEQMRLALAAQKSA